MLIVQHAPGESDILDFIDQSIRNLAEAGSEARTVVMGPAAFRRFKAALAARLGREEREFGTYNYLPVLVDPFRSAQVCVLPEPREISLGVEVVDLTEE